MAGGEAINDELLLDGRGQGGGAFGMGMHPCRPRKFRRANGREVEITEIGLVHPTVQGRRTVHMFDVTDGQADYRLEFDSFHLTWRLTMEGDRVG